MKQIDIKHLENLNFDKGWRLGLLVGFILGFVPTIVFILL